jgi:uncharacterized membrane protein YeaQ/YmgE (transglycosylase-associated protein family)
MGIIFAIIGALIVGVLARFFYPGEIKLSWPLSIGLGFAGGLLGKTVSFVLGAGFAGGLITSILGAILLIFLYRQFLEAKLSKEYPKVFTPTKPIKVKKTSKKK